MKRKKILGFLTPTMVICVMFVVTAFAIGVFVGQIKYYDEESTYNTHLQPVSNQYLVNAAGQTYGSAMFAEARDDRPDLMAAVGNNGVSGYVYSADLEEESPETLDEALAQQEMYDALIANWDGETPIVIRTIPLYASDGQTVIGEYDISFVPSDAQMW